MASADDRRQHQVTRLKNRLSERGNPQTFVFFILVMTGMVGFVASYLMRAGGLAHYMGLRYLLAVVIAYLAFLGMIGLWLQIVRPRRSSLAPPAADVVDMTVRTDLDVGVPLVHAGDVAGAAAEEAVSSGDGGSKGLGSIGDVGDGEGVLLIVVVLIVIAALAAFLASVWIIIEAPLLLAELLVDGALVAGMARGLTRRSTEGWAMVALRRTFVPFLITAAAFGGVGFALQMYVPQATTMLEAVKIAAE